jgi:hypothetical protein
MSLSESERVVLSVNKSEDRLVQFGRSFIYIRKRIGPRIKPCGTPLSIFNIELDTLLIEMNWFLFDK